jgi:acetylornithine deacetylase/succinyl-diaminopimelate desuccinylase-like protein
MEGSYMSTTDAVPGDVLDRVLAQIDEDEVVELALSLATIDSPTGQEGAASDRVFEWLEKNGFAPQRLGLYPDRANVVARRRGSEGAPSLLFNSHLDTTVRADELLSSPRAAAPEYHSAWRDGRRLVGNGIVNNKGVMATWMVACKALKQAGVKLRGDLVMTMVVGEIGVEPIDEFQPPEYIAKEAGARYLVNRGVTADYGIVAEGTDFALCWVEAGKSFYKISVHGHEPPLYTPYLPRPTDIVGSPNAIVRTAAVLEAFEAWAYAYEQANIYRCDGGTVVPKASIGAIRSGLPYKITKTPSICHLYADVRIAPGADVRAIERDLRSALEATGVPVTVEPYVFRAGYEAQGVEPLVEKVEAAHTRVLGGSPGRPMDAITSMWRDSNVFNEVGIPTLVYGPGASTGGGNLAMEIDAMVAAARVYAAIAIEVCGVAE